MMNIKVTKDDDQRDFSAWTAEKTRNALSALSNLITDFPDIKNNDEFYNLLDNLISLYAYFNDNLERLKTDIVRNLLINYGSDGFVFLEDLIFHTCKGKIKKAILQMNLEKKIIKK